MKMINKFNCFVACFLLSGPAWAGGVLESQETQAKLVELFSSEGCSDCPPADAWFTRLRERTTLWKTFVPVTFHVDYWNRLGWTDRFSKEQFTSRQNVYAYEWGKKSVYTPAFVLNGVEWRRQESVLDEKGAAVGVLKAVQAGPRTFAVTFRPAKGMRPAEWTVHGALLGNGFETKVAAGENRGKTLKHEFVALSLADKPLVPKDGALAATIELASPGALKPKSYGAAFWVTANGSEKAVQAVGGDLDGI